MSHFTKDFTQFFKDLEKNNNKEWFDNNRKRYETAVKKPLYNFVDEMIGRINAVDLDVQIQAKDAVTRINRDIRFSADKTPYNTHMGAVISSAGRKDKSVPGVFLRLDASYIHVFGGAHGISTQQLAKVRSAIAEDPEHFMTLISESDFVKKFGEVKGEKSKRMPKEFADLAEKYPILMHKSFYYVGKIGGEYFTEDDLPEMIMEYWQTAKPVKDFLTKALQ
ncbi:MAG: DUF2461 domain-containing protein [Bacteroidota bacterium]